MGKAKWVTPFKKQCFVTAGVAINVAQFGIVMAFTAVLLPQLRAHTTTIPIDDSSGSWIAAIPGFALVIGNFTIPSIMSKYGRKIANLVSIVPLFIGWLTIVFANSIPWLLLARLLQGLSMGMSTSLGPILIGEYASPRNRGAFLTTMSLSMSIGTLIVHTLGSYLSWQTTALICAVITFIDFIIVIYSPESPSWLAAQGRFEDCTKVFYWLRGETEEDELKKMLEANEKPRDSISVHASETNLQKIQRDFAYFIKTVRKREFYKPIFITIHMYIVAHWGGINLLSAYTLDTFHHVIGDGINNALVIITLDMQRLISSILAVFVIRKFRRRTMLFVTLSITIASFFVTAGYTYAKASGVLPFDHPAIGITLIHIHTFSVVTGSLPLPMVIAGEVFPLKYRSIAGGISAVFYSLNFFITVKTVPILLKTIHIYGTYCLYGSVVCYCLVIAWFYLPETKDRTLQEIEEAFTGKPKDPEDLKSAEPLKTWKSNGVD